MPPHIFPWWPPHPCCLVHLSTHIHTSIHVHTSTQLLSVAAASQLHGRLALMTTLRRGLEALRPEWKYKMLSAGAEAHAAVHVAVHSPGGSTDSPRRRGRPARSSALGLPKWWLPLHDEQLAQVRDIVGVWEDVWVSRAGPFFYLGRASGEGVV